MMKRLHFFVLALAILTLVLITAVFLRHEDVAPTGSIPGRIILTWTGDPAHTQAVTWRTSTPLQSPQAQIAKLDANPDFEETAVTVAGTSTTDHLGEARMAGHYAANFTDLDPNTKYCYRVGDGRTWSEWNIFRTASNETEAFRFLYFGDAQNSIRSLWSRTVRTAYAKAPDARLMVHAGDLVASGGDDRQWGEWSDALGFISATMPSIPAPGNHDLIDPSGNQNAKAVFVAPSLWRHHFALPSNGPDIEEMRGQSYYIDYQGVRFVALDVNVWANRNFLASAKNRVADKQLAWLSQVLATNPNRWTIVTQHQAIYSATNDREYTEMRAALAPLYEKFHVDLVLQGHDHVYARTHKVAHDGVVDPSAEGPIYVISVSGAKMYEFHDVHRELMAKVIEQKQFFQVVDISPKRLLFTAYTVDGVVADSFELLKSGTTSTYVNGAPLAP